MSRYTNYAIKNNVFGTLSAPISSLATTIQLATGQGQRFTADMLATLESVEGNKVTKREIVLITNVTGDTLTVVRKYAPCPSNDDANTQGQTSFSFDVDDTINIYIPKEIFDLINNGIKFLETQGTDRMRVLEAASGTPLAIDIMPGNFRCADDNIVYAGVTDQLLTDNATNYIMIDGTGTLQITTTDRDTRYTRLAKVTCASGEITEIQDRRLDTIGGNLGGLAIHPLTEKTTPASTDELVIADSADSFNNKRITVANMSVQNIVRFVTLGENVTAGNGQGAAYIHTDGKAYLTDLANHSNPNASWADGVIIDSGSAGDTVRMVVDGNIPYTTNGALSLLGTVASTSGTFTTNTVTVSLGGVKNLQKIYISSALSYTDYWEVFVDSVLVGVYSGVTQYIDLHGVRGSSVKIQAAYIYRGYFSNQSISGSKTLTVYYYDTGNAGKYSINASNYHIGYAKNGNFILKRKYIEKSNTMSILGPNPSPSYGYTTSFQAAHSGNMVINYRYTDSYDRNPKIFVMYSPDNTTWYNLSVGSMTKESSGYVGTTGQFNIPIIQGYYYKCYYYGDGSSCYIGCIHIDHIIYDS